MSPAEEGALEIGVERRVPHGFGHIIHGTPLGDPGAIDQHVEAAQFFRRRVHQRAAGFRAGNVAGGGDSAATQCCNRLADRLFAAPVHGHPRARGEERLRRGPPDAARAAGDEHALGREVEAHLPFHCGLRFSAKARAPSSWSSLE